jgi:cysteine-rich repeat protein
MTAADRRLSTRPRARETVGAMGIGRACSTGVLVAAVAGAHGCVVGGTFVCTADEQCPQGSCEAAGFCSFPDDACGSGRRFSEWAGGALANACAPTVGSESSSSSSGASGDETSSTTLAPDLGPPAERKPSSISCGNAVIEIDEPCDDGNEIDGDGCNHDCVVSGTPLWTVVEDGPNSGEDYAHAVATVVGGNAIVTGRDGANAGDLFVKGYAGTDGVKLWSKQESSSATEEGRTVATDDGIRFFVGGFVTSAQTGESVFTRAFDLDRTDDPGIAWTKNAALQGDDRVLAAALRPDHAELLVFGYSRAPDDTTTHVRAYQVDDGTPTWNVTPDIDTAMAQLEDDARDGIVTTEGRVFVVGAIVAPGQGGRSDGWLAELDVAMSPAGLGFGPLARSGTADAVDVISAIAEAPDGTLVVAGQLAQRGFYARYDLGLDQLEMHIPDPVSPSEILGLAIDGTGAVITVGYTTSELHGRDIEVVKYLVDGTRLWRDREDGSAGEDDVGRGVAIGADDSVIAVGNLREIVTGSDLWVRKYAP